MCLHVADARASRVADVARVLSRNGQVLRFSRPREGSVSFPVNYCTADALRIRISPSWNVVATSSPLSVHTSPRAKPRPPEATGELITWQSHSVSMRKREGWWKCIEWDKLPACICGSHMATGSGRMAVSSRPQSDTSAGTHAARQVVGRWGEGGGLLVSLRRRGWITSVLCR